MGHNAGDDDDGDDFDDDTLQLMIHMLEDDIEQAIPVAIEPIRFDVREQFGACETNNQKELLTADQHISDHALIKFLLTQWRYLENTFSKVDKKPNT